MSLGLDDSIQILVVCGVYDIVYQVQGKPEKAMKEVTTRSLWISMYTSGCPFLIVATTIEKNGPRGCLFDEDIYLCPGQTSSLSKQWVDKGSSQVSDSGQQ